jgi:hypothetical protein
VDETNVKQQSFEWPPSFPPPPEGQQTAQFNMAMRAMRTLLNESIRDPRVKLLFPHSSFFEDEDNPSYEKYLVSIEFEVTTWPDPVTPSGVVVKDYTTP